MRIHPGLIELGIDGKALVGGPQIAAHAGMKLNGDGAKMVEGWRGRGGAQVQPHQAAF